MSVPSPEPAPPDGHSEATSTPRQNFAGQIRMCWPGGKYIADHVEDGPWHLTPTVFRDHVRRPSINWLVELAESAYPPIRVPFFDGYTVTEAAVFIVPSFVHRLFEWYSDSDTDFWVIDETVEDFTFDTEPTPGDQLLACVVGLTGLELDASLVESVTRHGSFDTFVAFLRSLDASALDADSYTEQVAAYAASTLP